MEVQESSREVPACCWNKNIWDWKHWRGEDQSPFTCISLPPQQHSSVTREKFPACCLCRMRKWACRWAPSCPNCAGLSLRGSLLSHPVQNREIAAQLEWCGWENCQQASSRASKGCRSYILQNSSGSLPTSHWGWRTCGPPRRPPCTPNALCTSPTHTPTPWLAPCALPSRGWCASFYRWLGSMHKKLAWLQDLEKAHKLELLTPS